MNDQTKQILALGAGLFLGSVMIAVFQPRVVNLLN